MTDELGTGLSMESAPATDTADAPWEQQPLGDSGTIADTNDIYSGQDANAAGDQGPDAGIPGLEAGGAQPAQPSAQPGSEGAISDSDRAWAKGMGMTDEAIAAFPNAMALRTALGGIVSQVIAAATGGAAQPPQPGQVQGQNGQQDAPASLRLDLTKFAGYDELTDEAQQLVSAISDHAVNVMAQVVQAVSQEVTSLREQIGALQVSHYDAQLQRSLANLDGEWKLLAAKYDDSKARREVLWAMNAVAESYLRARQPVPSWDSLLQTVLYARHSKELAEAQQKARRESLRKNDSMLANHAAGPGSARRVNAIKGGTETAVAKVAEILGR